MPECAPSLALQIHREAIRAIALSHRVTNVRVFGSVLTGDDTDDSDLDILVEPTKQTTLMDIAAIQHELKYAELSEEKKDQWDELEWNEDGTAPDAVDSVALNKWLFNTDTVDKVLEHLMTRGEKEAGGDRLGKTIIFAKNNEHADFIAERFNVLTD